ncbi:hypothetical protein [Paenibacillus oryzisoli]|uniref:Uncharacterized protein n=1 Tax=Paenibacillus oryzisoli TaxID=1850517 RepID=A0A198A101_9BACL|nr:hypothetical protein [Paenibacillus oryzisoli]OAS14693.1 hypothetical protein A8708_23615 [Paenibacillus oryzisoli]
MYLREFDLDLPYIVDKERIQAIMNEKKCEYHDATKFDYNLNWDDKRRSFRLETRCITAMFERLFVKMKTEDCKKVLIECVESITDERILNFSGIVTVQVKSSYNEFILGNDDEKKRTTLNLLLKGIEKISREKDWVIDAFRDVSSQIEKIGYLNEWIWRKAVKSPQKKYYAEVLCQHNVKSMDISILIRQMDGTEVRKIMVISELPDEFAYAKHLGQLVWTSESEVVLVNKNGDNMVAVRIE